MRRIRKGSDMLFSLVWRNKKRVFLVFVALFILSIFGDIIIPAAIILALGTAASFSTSYKRVIRMPPAIELVTFTTIIVSLAYGPIIGAVFAGIVTLTAEIMTNALDIFIISFVPSRIIIALTAGFFFNMFDGNIFLTGVASTILYNNLAQPFYLFLADVQMRAKSFFFVFLNIGTNFIFFTVLGPLLVKLLGI